MKRQSTDSPGVGSAFGLAQCLLSTDFRNRIIVVTFLERAPILQVTMNAIDLLNDFRLTRSDAAFADLMRRFGDLVYSVAKRRLGNAALAEEASQTVFARLAQAPPKLTHDGELTGWLHRTTLHVAIDLWRSETRRQTRERRAVLMQSPPSENDSLWDELAPMLDEALDKLAEPDRKALLFRFFEHKAIREVGRMLGVSEDAAKMRIGRAVERLRSQFALRGIHCAASTLAALLAERSVEAAPSSLAAVLGAKASRDKNGTAAGLGGLDSLVLVSKMKLAGGLALVLCVGIGIVTLFRSLTASPPGVTSPAVEEVGARTTSPAPGSRQAGQAPAAKATVFRSANPPLPEIERLAFRVVDAENGEGLAGARIHTAYFYAGGRGEAHDTVTDQTGMASLSEAFEPNAQGANVFVVAEGYVPKVVNLREDDPRREYTMKLERAVTIGGVVIDEQNRPLAGVSIRVQGRGDHKEGAENVDFQLCPVTSDSDGRWKCSYIPKDFDKTRLILTRDDFAVTLPDVPMSKANLTNLALIMSRGFTVTGRVSGSDGRAIPGARVKELNNSGYRQQSTITDEEGTFTIAGTGEFDAYTSSPPEYRANGSVALRGLVGSGGVHVTLVVEAEGFAPESRKISLAASTSTAAFALRPAVVFRGRIVDQDNRPIPKAVVRTDSDIHGLIKFRWSTTTDADGRFEWMSAPSEPTLFWFEADGYKVRREVLLTPDGTEHEIKLER